MPIKPGTLTAKGQETRQRIVAAAARLMFESGVSDTTIEDVRARAGVSNSQVYHYFADKTALVRAVIEYQTDAVIEPQQPLFARLDTMEGLREWRDFAVARQRELKCRGGCPIASLTSQLAENDEAARLQLAHSFARWSAGLRAGLTAMHAKGTLRPDADPEALSLSLLASLQGGLLMSQLDRDTRALEVALDAALAYIESQTRQVGHPPRIGIAMPILGGNSGSRMPSPVTRKAVMTTTPIADQTAALQTNMAQQVPADVLAPFAEERQELAAAGIPDGVARPGTELADAELMDAHGGPTSLHRTLGGRPAVVVFYRGAWCPYCNLTLRTYQAELVEPLAERGAALVAISPQQPDGSLTMQETNGLTFTVLSDPGNTIARRLGILTEATEKAKVSQAALGIDVAATNADGTAVVPMPTTVIVDASGTIRWIDVHPDYGTRSEPAEILSVYDAAL